MRVLACIPAFNEEKVIQRIVAETLRYVDDVVVCDDGSYDKTSLLAEQAGAHVIKHKENRGKGAALKSLFNYAKNSNYEVFVTMDGDGQFLPEEIPKLSKPIIEGNSDIVIGYRYDSSEQMPHYRKIGNKFLDKMTNMVSDLPFRDTQSGFRGYSKKAINVLEFQSKGFAADSEILVDASKKGLHITETKITVLYDTGFKTSTKNPVSHIGEIVIALLEFIALKRPLLYLGVPGLFLISLGIFFTIFVLTTFNATRYFSIPFAIISLGSFIIGIMLLLMSVILFGIMRAIQNKSNN